MPDAFVAAPAANICGWQALRHPVGERNHHDHAAADDADAFAPPRGCHRHPACPRSPPPPAPSPTRNAPRPGPLGPAGAAAGGGMTGADVWRVFRANLWLIALLRAGGAVAGFLVNHFLAKNYPKFTASGLVRVQLAEEQFRFG